MKKLTLALMLAGVIGFNQAIAANAIIENEYVRAGVNESTGTLGSGGGTRPGLQYDNTGTSTWPSNSSQGDYLTPGSPFEGFTVRIEDATSTLIRTYTNNNTGARSITDGAWVTTPTAASAIWSATTSDFGIQNTYSLPLGQKYIEIDTQITATSAMPKLWFGRFIDPDAMPMPGDTSATDNARGYGAIPVTNVVFSEATVSRYALGLYSSATNVGTGISPMWTTNPADYYTNVGGYNVGNGDHTIGLGFLVNNVAIGDILHFNYAYIFGPSAFGAATSAVAGGAGGGTAGTVPGGGTLVDVGSATDAASGTTTTPSPTVTGTSTATITVSDVTAISATLPVITASLAHHEASEATGVQTIARETTTNVTTPMERTLVTKVRTTSTWSDSTTSFVDATPVTAVTVSNSVATSIANNRFSGRVDQYEQLGELNTGINRGLNSQLFRKDMVEGKGYRMYMGGAYLDSSAANGYNAKSDKFNIGVEKDVKEFWIVGAQYNRVNTKLDGVDSATKQGKNHYGAYSILTRNDWILKTDLGIADNSLNSNRNVAGLFYNASNTSGTDWWLTNRVYTPDLNGFRPYAGYTVGKDKRDAYTETGSIQSYRTVASITENTNHGEIGVRYDKTIDKITLTGEAGITSDSYKDVRGAVSYQVNPRSRISLTASRQEHKDLSTNVIGLQGRIDF
jgi:hypothetical protein